MTGSPDIAATGPPNEASANDQAPASPRRGVHRDWPLGAYFALLLVVFAASAAAAIVYVSLQADHDARAAAERNASFAARTAAGQLGKSLAVVRATVAQLAANPQVAQAFTHPGGCSLEFAVGGAFTRGHLDILRPDGSVACSSLKRRAPSRLAGYHDANWLARANREPLFVAPTADRRTGERALLISAPIKGGGVVASFAALAPVGHELVSLYGGGHPSEFLITNDHIVIARSLKPQHWIGRSLVGTRFAATRGRVERPDLDGKRRLYAEAVVPGVGWRLHVGEDKQAALAAGNQLRNRELWIIAAGLVVFLLATLLIYRRVALPLKRLDRAVRESDPYAASPTEIRASGTREVVGLAHTVNGLVSSIGRELRHRHELEQQLRHAQKMDALGRVAAGVAHDFNNLVTVIGGFSSLIVKSLHSDEQIRAHAREVGHAAERAALLIRQLLLFSRKETAEAVALDASEVTAGMKAMLGRLLGGKIELIARLDAEPATVKADRGQLEQVLMNLAVNARDAMPEGGWLTLETETVTLEPAAADTLRLEVGRYVLIRVSDTGSGMDARTQERLFEPFFTTKEADKGTGLGLATCYGIVTQFGGRIDVASEIGRGSVFSVYLPLVETVVEPAGEAAPEEPAGAGSETVLLVEDDAGLRTLAKTVLEDAGYTVLDARFGEEALWVADRHEGRIDLLLTDGVMPMMSGAELASRFFQFHPEAKIIYMSGYDREPAPEGDAAPEGTFLAKPFTPDGLLEKVQETLAAE